MPEIEKKVVAQYAKISESKNRNLEVRSNIVITKSLLLFYYLSNKFQIQILYREYKKFCSHWPFYGSFFFPIQCTNKVRLIRPLGKRLMGCVNCLLIIALQPARLSALQGHTLTLGINTKCITIISKEPCVSIHHLYLIYHPVG